MKMWETFWPDTLVAVIGAILTAATAYITYLLNVRRREIHVLKSLVYDFYHRRAIAPEPNLITIENATEKDDFLHANLSVLSMRNEIGHIRNVVWPINDLNKILSELTRACNNYLESSAQQPDQYQRLLEKLRKEISKQIRKLAANRCGVYIREPGEGAL